jgi:hypothetical protein
MTTTSAHLDGRRVALAPRRALDVVDAGVKIRAHVAESITASARASGCDGRGLRR